MVNQEVGLEKIYQIKKGFCLIINIINFDERKDLKRNGSEKSVRLIKEAFKYHGFKVKNYDDLNDYEILNLIDKQVNKIECKSYDAFVLYIHTHGFGDSILCKNSYVKDEANEVLLTNIIHFHQIIEIFKNENCENLLHRPKLIFFDCERNSKLSI